MMDFSRVDRSEVTKCEQQSALYSERLSDLRLRQDLLTRECRHVKEDMESLHLLQQTALAALAPYMSFFSDNAGIFVGDVVQVDEVSVVVKHVSGIELRQFESVRFKKIVVPYFQTSPWLLKSLPLLKVYLTHEVHRSLLVQSSHLLRKALSEIVRQRNLIETMVMPSLEKSIGRIMMMKDHDKAMKMAMIRVAAKRRSGDSCKGMAS